MSLEGGPCPSRRRDNWRHARIVLSPINPEYEPIVFSPDESGQVAVIAEVVTVLRGEV